MNVIYYNSSHSQNRYFSPQQSPVVPSSPLVVPGESPGVPQESLVVPQQSLVLLIVLRCPQQSPHQSSRSPQHVPQQSPSASLVRPQQFPRSSRLAFSSGPWVALLGSRLAGQSGVVCSRSTASSASRTRRGLSAPLYQKPSNPLESQ